MKNIKAGQKYKTRGSEVAEVLEVKLGAVFPVRVQIGNRPFLNVLTITGKAEQGRFKLNDDLIELIVD